MSIAPRSSMPSEAAAPRAPAGQSVMAALRHASQRTGVDFSYLVAKCAQESSFDPNAKAASSSATGLFQFIDRTWLDMVERHGARHGLGAEAASIRRRPDGSAFVADPQQRRAILDLRKDPKLSALMAGEYARENKAHLEQEVGGRVGSTELYMAHFLGAGGASRFLSALRENPGQDAAALLPEAASANRAVFYDPSGRARSLGEVYNRFAAKFDGEPVDMPERAWHAGPVGGGQPCPAGGAPHDRMKAMQGEPLSLFTVMVIAQLGLPGDGKPAESAAQLPRPQPPQGL